MPVALPRAAIRAEAESRSEPCGTFAQSRAPRSMRPWRRTDSRSFGGSYRHRLMTFVSSKVAGGATPGPSVQQWAADLIALVGSDPVHRSFVPALRSDQPNCRRYRYRLGSYAGLQLLLDRLGRVSDLPDGRLELLGRDAELLRPVAHFVVFACVYTRPVLRPLFEGSSAMAASSRQHKNVGERAAVPDPPKRAWMFTQ